MSEKRGILVWKFPWVRWILLSSMVNCAFVLAFVAEWGIVPVMMLGWITAEMQFRLSKGRLPKIWVYLSILGYSLAAIYLRDINFGNWSVQNGPVIYRHIANAALIVGISQLLAFYRCIPQGIVWGIVTSLAWRYGSWLPVYIATHFTYRLDTMMGFDIIWDMAIFIIVIGPSIFILLGVIPSLLTGAILSWLRCKQPPELKVSVARPSMDWTKNISGEVRMRLERLVQLIASIIPDRRISRGRWILFTTLGVGIAAGTSMVVVTKIESMGALSWSIVLFGVGIGLLQWIVLRRVIDFGWWILTSALGAAPALVIVMNLRSVLTETQARDGLDWITLAILIVTVGLIFAAGMAVMQWLALRERFESTKSWLGASVVGWWLGSICGTVVALAISYLVHYYVEFLRDIKEISSIAVAAWPVAIGGAVAGVIAAAISWRALCDLLPGFGSADLDTTNLD